MSGAIGDILASAVGVALSPIPIIAVILMLATPRARSNGFAFSLGWIAGLVVVAVVVLAVAGDASDPGSTASDGVNWVHLGLGALFLVMAARQWRSRPREGHVASMPGWMATIDRFTAWRSLLLGAALSAANPKNLALTLAAAASIAQAGLSGGDTTIAVAVFVVVASVTVVSPTLCYIVAPARARGALASLKEFMIQHNAVILFVVLLVLGTKLIGDGLGILD